MRSERREEKRREEVDFRGDVIVWVNYKLYSFTIPITYFPDEGSGTF